MAAPSAAAPSALGSPIKGRAEASVLHLPSSPALRGSDYHRAAVAADYGMLKPTSGLLDRIVSGTATREYFERELSHSYRPHQADTVTLGSKAKPPAPRRASSASIGLEAVLEEEEEEEEEEEAS